MKTPREILFSRHKTVAPKLDGLRQVVIHDLPEQRGVRQGLFNALVHSLLHITNRIWQELFLPCRRIWIGFAAVWILLFIINIAQRDQSTGAMAQASPSAGMMMAYRDQQKILDELLAETPTPRPAIENRQRNFISKPRSEIVETIAI